MEICRALYFEFYNFDEIRSERLDRAKFMRGINSLRMRPILHLRALMEKGLYCSCIGVGHKRSGLRFNHQIIGPSNIAVPRIIKFANIYQLEICTFAFFFGQHFFFQFFDFRIFLFFCKKKKIK